MSLHKCTTSSEHLVGDVLTNITVKVDATNSNVTFFNNGTSETVNGDVLFTASTSNLNLGKDGGIRRTVSNFRGSVDVVKIYDELLTDNQMEDQIYKFDVLNLTVADGATVASDTSKYTNTVNMNSLTASDDTGDIAFDTNPPTGSSGISVTNVYGEVLDKFSYSSTISYTGQTGVGGDDAVLMHKQLADGGYIEIRIEKTTGKLVLDISDQPAYNLTATLNESPGNVTVTGTVIGTPEVRIFALSEAAESESVLMTYVNSLDNGGNTSYNHKFSSLTSGATFTHNLTGVLHTGTANARPIFSTLPYIYVYVVAHYEGVPDSTSTTKCFKLKDPTFDTTSVVVPTNVNQVYDNKMFTQINFVGTVGFHSSENKVLISKITINPSVLVSELGYETETKYWVFAVGADITAATDDQFQHFVENVLQYSIDHDLNMGFDQSGTDVGYIVSTAGPLDSNEVLELEDKHLTHAFPDLRSYTATEVDTAGTLPTVVVIAQTSVVTTNSSLATSLSKTYYRLDTNSLTVDPQETVSFKPKHDVSHKQSVFTHVDLNVPVVADNTVNSVSTSASAQIDVKYRFEKTSGVKKVFAVALTTPSTYFDTTLSGSDTDLYAAIIDDASRPTWESAIKEITLAAATAPAYTHVDLTTTLTKYVDADGGGVTDVVQGNATYMVKLFVIEDGRTDFSDVEAITILPTQQQLSLDYTVLTSYQSIVKQYVAVFSVGSLTTLPANIGATDEEVFTFMKQRVSFGGLTGVMMIKDAAQFIEPHERVTVPTKLFTYVIDAETGPAHNLIPVTATGQQYIVQIFLVHEGWDGETVVASYSSVNAKTERTETYLTYVDDNTREYVNGTVIDTHRQGKGTYIADGSQIKVIVCTNEIDATVLRDNTTLETVYTPHAYTYYTYEGWHLDTSKYMLLNPISVTNTGDVPNYVNQLMSDDLWTGITSSASTAGNKLNVQYSLTTGGAHKGYVKTSLISTIDISTLASHMKHSFTTPASTPNLFIDFDLAETCSVDEFKYYTTATVAADEMYVYVSTTEIDGDTGYPAVDACTGQIVNGVKPVHIHANMFYAHTTTSRYTNRTQLAAYGTDNPYFHLKQRFGIGRYIRVYAKARGSQTVVGGISYEFYGYRAHKSTGTPYAPPDTLRMYDVVDNSTQSSLTHTYVRQLATNTPLYVYSWFVNGPDGKVSYVQDLGNTANTTKITYYNNDILLNPVKYSSDAATYDKYYARNLVGKTFAHTLTTVDGLSVLTITSGIVTNPPGGVTVSTGYVKFSQGMTNALSAITVSETSAFVPTTADTKSLFVDYDLGTSCVVNRFKYYAHADTFADEICVFVSEAEIDGTTPQYDFPSAEDFDFDVPRCNGIQGVVIRASDVYKHASDLATMKTLINPSRLDQSPMFDVHAQFGTGRYVRVYSRTSESTQSKVGGIGYEFYGNYPGFYANTRVNPVLGGTQLSSKLVTKQEKFDMA